MHPVLFKIPLFEGISIHTYGLMVALAFLAGLVWVKFEAKRTGESPARATDLVFWIIISAIIGSRILYVIITAPAEIVRQPIILVKIWEGGLVFYGGLIAAIITAIIYTKKYHLSFWKYADIFAPAIPLGHVFGRIGCFMAGCCHGRPAPPDAWWAVVFPQVAGSSAPTGIPLYPTQLAEALGELLIFVGLAIFRRHKGFHGQLLAIYLILYAILRSFIEMYRGDIDRGFIIDEMLSTSQFISIIMVAFALVIWFVNRTRFPVEKK